MAVNIYANKPFLNQQMASIFQANYTQASRGMAPSTWSATGSTITVDASLNVGTYIDVSLNGTGKSFAVLGAIGQSGANATYQIDMSLCSTPTTITAVSIAQRETTVQGALNQFLLAPSSISNYYLFCASLVSSINAVNALHPTTGYANGKNGVRVFVTSDDGTPIFDSGKCTHVGAQNQITSLVSSATQSSIKQGNTYNNYLTKLGVFIGGRPDLNTTTVTGVDGPVTLSFGVAGGNQINENHHTRPEILGALFKESGIAFCKRYSSTTSSVNFYMAQRLGMSSEDNVGAIRINVPMNLSLV